MWPSAVPSYCEATNTRRGAGPREWTGIMAFDDNSLNAALSATVRDSYNDDETNELTVNSTVSDSGNTDDSVNDSYNDTRNADGSYHWGSYNTETDTAHSGNTDSYNDLVDLSDNSTTNNTDTSTNDNSINAGVRSYSTGFGDVGGAAAAAGGGGDMMIDSRSTIVDQSVNGNVAADGPVFSSVSSDAVVNSGDGAFVAGDDVNVTYNIDESTSISADGDILMDSTKTVNTSINSGNDYSFTSNWTDTSQDWDIDDSNNAYDWSSTVSGSYNDSGVFDSTTNVDVDVNAIVDSVGSGIADGTDLGM